MHILKLLTDQKSWSHIIIIIIIIIINIIIIVVVIIIHFSDLKAIYLFLKRVRMSLTKLLTFTVVPKSSSLRETSRRIVGIRTSLTGVLADCSPRFEFVSLSHLICCHYS